jgi:hypothetical protein
MKTLVGVEGQFHESLISAPDGSGPRRTTHLCPMKLSRQNLGLTTDYRDCGFPWYLSVSPGKCGEITSNQAMTASFRIHEALIALLFNAIRSELLTETPCLLAPSEGAPYSCWIGGWVRPRDGVGAMKMNTFVPEGIETRFSDHSARGCTHCTYTLLISPCMV